MGLEIILTEVLAFQFDVFFKEIYCTESIYSMYKVKLQIVPLTNLDKYVRYGTSGTEVNMTAVKSYE
jgi:hypothetical protein